jgi:hypothetical protein
MQRFRLLACALLAIGLLACQAQTSTNELFRDHGLPTGTRFDVLPQGAIVHAQFGSLYKTLLRLEQLATNTVPTNALPPPLQSLTESGHPLLALLGMQVFGEPLTAEKIGQQLGLDPQKPVSLSLYAGDPRKAFILVVPLANPKAFEEAIRSNLNPPVMEETMLSNKPAVHIETRIQNQPVELYVACSASEAYICGGRSLAIALHSTPANQRLSQDAFMRQAIAKAGDQDLSIILNPTTIKPILMQAQQLGAMVVPLIQMQRQKLVEGMRPEVKARLESQLRQHLGVRDFNEFADYAECVVIATYQCLSDSLAKQMIAFEGGSLMINLDPAFPQTTLDIYSQQYQIEKATRSLPMPEVRKAMAWLGPGLNSFSATGRQPEITPSTGLLSWIAQMKTAMTAKGLKTGALDLLRDWLQNEPIHQSIATQVPWLLTAYVPLDSSPSIRDYRSLEKYLTDLSRNFSLARRRPVWVAPGNDLNLLESYFQGGVRVANEQEKRSGEFRAHFNPGASWFDHTNRFAAADAQSGIRRYTQESTYTTRGGVFGFDEHELINRRFIAGRAVNGYLVYHQGARDVTWLASLDQNQAAGITPAFDKLLSRLPEDANYFRLHRALGRLPEMVDWIARLETLAHADLEAYLDSAEKIQKSAASPEAAQKALAELPMPMLAYSLNRDGANRNLYCLLPGGIVFPRQKATAILQDLTADFNAKSSQLGGGMIYTRVRPGAYELAVIQSTEAASYLVSTVAAKVIDRYVGSPEKQAALRQAIVAEGDANPERYDEIIVANPTWAFLKTPPKHQAVKTVKGIPKRDTNTPPELLNLSKQYNAGLKQPWHGSNRMTNTLANLPTGVQEFAGVKFDVRGIVQLSGKKLLQQAAVRYPKEVKGIPVKQSAAQIHFLHATAWSVPEGTPIGGFRVNYANGESRDIPIVYGQDVRDWWSAPEEPASDTLQIAWTGLNTVSPENGTRVRLFKTTWKNPVPEEPITRIDYHTAMTDSAPFLIAITLDPAETAVEPAAETQPAPKPAK